MPELSDEERIRRRQAVDFARGSVELSRGGLDSELGASNTRFVAGELSDSEHIDALLAHGRDLPVGEPVQKYFTSFRDAVKASSSR